MSKLEGNEEGRGMQYQNLCEFCLFCHKIQRCRVSIKKKKKTKHNESILQDTWKRAEFQRQQDLSHRQEQDLWEAKRNRPLKKQYSPWDPAECFTVTNLLHSAPG